MHSESRYEWFRISNGAASDLVTATIDEVSRRR